MLILRIEHLTATTVFNDNSFSYFMQISEAIDMIRNAEIDNTRPVVWADLGCGNGVFTKALAHILPDQSTIYAIDRSDQSIQLPEKINVTLHFLRADFERDALPLPVLNGVLMGNSFHFVADKKSFLERLIREHPFIDTFIIIEYTIRQSNPWVPYPIDFPELKELFEKSGYKKIVQLAERKSVFQRGNMYACSARKG
jgi:SAM-dependent methyltransferase